MNRRTYVAIVGAATATGLAGCVGEFGVDEDDADGDENGTDDAESDGENATDDEGDGDEHGAVQAVESYMAAAADGDPEGMSEAMHSHHPFDPVEMAAEAEENDDVEFSIGDDEIDDYEVELADEEFDFGAIRGRPYVEFWFDDVDLDEVFEGEEAALVDVEVETTADGETVTEAETFIALTEDGDWTVFFVYEEPPEIPDGEPVEGDEYRIVEDLEFDESEERVAVHLERDLGIDAEEVTVYSTSLRTENVGYGSDDVEGFPITMLSSGFDPEGDEIVVTATVDGEEVVVRRETYEP